MLCFPFTSFAFIPHSLLSFHFLCFPFACFVFLSLPLVCFHFLCFRVQAETKAKLFRALLRAQSCMKEAESPERDALVKVITSIVH
jgi:hypothetical protein